MAAYVRLAKDRKANGKHWRRGAVVHLPNAVARAEERRGGTRLSRTEAIKHLEAEAKKAEAKAKAAAAKKTKLAEK